MKNIIKHFIVELESLSDNYSYNSEMYKKIKNIITELEEIISSINQELR